MKTQLSGDEKHKEALFPSLDKKILKAARDYALENYPKEACGLLFQNRLNLQFDLFVPCRNTQDRLHDCDPIRYPRDAGQAYNLDQREVEEHQKKVSHSHCLRGIFHSHIDVGVYFSEEDYKMACPWGEPLFPDYIYLIWEIRQNKAMDVRMYLWCSQEKKFKEKILKI